MSQNLKASCNITHLLASRLHDPKTILQQQEEYHPSIIQPRKESIPQFNPYKVQKYHNPLSQRSRKHRLAQQKNLEIEKSNRMLFQKLRKIKLKNLYHSQKKISSIPQQNDSVMFPNSNYANQLKLPTLPSRQRTPSLTSVSTNSYHPKSHTNSTKSRHDKLHSILQDRTQFVEQYFNDLSSKKRSLGEEKELGVFVTQNGWKVKVIQVGEERVLLVGKKGRQELTKKYLLSKVRAKIQSGLQEWVKYKFSFEE